MTLSTIHPVTGEAISPLGYYRSGRPIWPIMGGSEAAPEGAPPAADPPTDGDPNPGTDDGKGGKAAVLADLAKERDQRQALERQVKDMQDAHKAQTAALAKAFGIAPEETSDTDKLTGQITSLAQRLDQITRDNLVLSVINEHPTLSREDRDVVSKITDEATMRAVAARLAEAAKPSGKPKSDPPATGAAGAVPVDLPGLPRIRAAYEAAQNHN